ncbi:MAG: hypothetical protein MZV64_23780 [Ignavibacteriales bacterium]|nr:hypothetical protein [Ignavibacteriales bacterium]
MPGAIAKRERAGGLDPQGVRAAAVREPGQPRLPLPDDRRRDPRPARAPAGRGGGGCRHRRHLHRHRALLQAEGPAGAGRAGRAAGLDLGRRPARAPQGRGHRQLLLAGGTGPRARRRGRDRQR